MPFRSKAQVEKFRSLVAAGEMEQETFDRWMLDTPNPEKLPARVAQGAPAKKPRRRKPGAPRKPSKFGDGKKR